MKKLTPSQLDQAASYLKTQARPLELALFEFYFENQPAERVLTCLAAFQNPDGGFGKALEPDMRSPSSSALATENGLRLLAELKVPATNPLVQRAVTYLHETLDDATHTWRVVPLDVNDHPHAPWWHDEAGSLARVFGDFCIIPRAGVLAALYHYSELVPKPWLDHITSLTLGDIFGFDPEKFNGGGDALVYACRLAEAPGLPEQDRDRLVNHLRIVANTIVTREPEQWAQYCTPPLKIAPSPKAFTAPVLQDCLPLHLDYLIDQQTPQGFWDVTWAWGDYPQAWEMARREWRGVLTLEALLSLRAYGRLS